MRLSEHDLDAVDDVAAFCDLDDYRPSLQCVWFADGWVAGTDSYRIDAREVDTDLHGSVNPFTLDAVDMKPLDWWSVVRSGPVRCEVSSITLSLAIFDRKPSLRTREVLCLGCLAWEKTDTGNLTCTCAAPIVDRRFLWEAIAAADEPEVRLRWRTNDLLKPLRYDEHEHFHLLMPIRRVEL